MVIMTTAILYMANNVILGVLCTTTSVKKVAENPGLITDDRKPLGHLFDKINNISDSKLHVADTGPTWILSSPGGPQVGPTLALRTLLSGIDWLRLGLMSYISGFM